jgi:hypothetical protein
MKKQSEIEIMVRAILGRDKFLMLNMNLIRLLGPNGACMLTYLLDKYEFLVKSKRIDDGEGMSIFRRELTDKLCLSPYQQRTIESDLKDKKFIRVQEQRVLTETFNLYFLDILEIYNFVEENIERTPLKNLTPP